MSSQTSTSTKTGRHSGASFFRKTAALGLTASVLGGALIMAPAAQAADIGWKPNPTKSVVGSPGEKGPNGHDVINNLGVWPGQKVEYNIGVDLNVGRAGQTVTSLQVVDKLPAGFTVDQPSIRVVGDNGLTLAASRDYKIINTNGTLTLAFSDKWVSEHVGPTTAAPLTRLAVSFTVTVSKDAKPYSSQDNVVTQIVNGESFTSPAASILIPGVDPGEAVSGSDGNAVGTRVAVGGDKLSYSVKLDGTFGADTPGKDGATGTSTPLGLAYDVDRFGIIDDFDEASVDISARDVRVLDSRGYDRSDLFTITSKAGVLSVLAKATGDRDSIPTSMLDEDYRVEYTAQVRDVAKTTNIVGTTVQVVDDREHPVAAETNVKVQASVPRTGAVVPASGKTAEKELKSVTQNSEFTYKLGSSRKPANRLVPVEAWLMVDYFTSGDRALHDTWSVVADTDIRGLDGKVLIAKGSVIADQGNTKYFTASFDADSVSVKATKAFLEAVNDDAASELGWSSYVRAVRTAEAGTRVANTSHEWSNGFDRSATVTTGTDAPVVEEKPVNPVKPAPIETAKPTPTETAKPTPTETAKPAPTETAKPAPTETAKPTPTETAKPTPTESAKPTPTPFPMPVPTETSKPEPSPTETSKPEPSPTETAKPTPTESPKPTETEKPTPNQPAAKRSISIESFVTSEGQEKGDHDSSKEPYAIAAPPADAKAATHDPVKVTYKITNTGETGLENVQLVIATQDNSDGSLGKTSGFLTDLSCETADGEKTVKGLDTLGAGGTATCEAVLTDIKPGTVYADIATTTAVVAKSDEKTAAVAEGAPATVKDTDQLNLSRAATGGAPDTKVSVQGATTTGTPGTPEIARGAVTGEAVSTTDRTMVGGGVAAILAALAAGALLLVRRVRGARVETE